jgi:HSP20 family protein
LSHHSGELANGCGIRLSDRPGVTASGWPGGRLKRKSPSEKPTMNTLTQWNPMRELEDFQSRILSAFNPDWSRRSGDGQNSRSSSSVAWMPLVDIAEDDSEYLITSELPEVKKEDVKVTVENGVLTITGERKFENEEKGKKYHRVERSYGSFTRSFVLPDDGDPAQIAAEFKDGLLKVRLAKSEKAKPKQIEVQVN